MTYTIHVWVREPQPDGTVKEWAEIIRAHNKYEAEPIYKRWLERQTDPAWEWNQLGREWGVSCPELEEPPELAPAAERVEWMKEIRRVRLGQAQGAT